MECVSQSQSAPRLLAVFVTCKSAGERDKIMKVFETIYCCQTPRTYVFVCMYVCVCVCLCSDSFSLDY